MVKYLDMYSGRRLTCRKFSKIEIISILHCHMFRREIKTASKRKPPMQSSSWIMQYIYFKKTAHKEPEPSKYALVIVNQTCVYYQQLLARKLNGPLGK